MLTLRPRAGPSVPLAVSHRSVVQPRWRAVTDAAVHRAPSVGRGNVPLASAAYSTLPGKAAHVAAVGPLGVLDEPPELHAWR